MRRGEGGGEEEEREAAQSARNVTSCVLSCDIRTFCNTCSCCCQLIVHIASFPALLLAAAITCSATPQTALPAPFTCGVVLEGHCSIDGLHPLLEGGGHISAQHHGHPVQQVLPEGALLRVVGGNQQRAAPGG
jgi:hypothetical protein